MLCHAAIAPFAMLASHRHTNHARHAKVLFVEFPQAQELVNNFFLFCETTKLWDEARLVEHGAEVEVSTQAVEDTKSKVKEYIRRICCCA
jgi:hypothetical protein